MINKQVRNDEVKEMADAPIFSVVLGRVLKLSIY